MDTTVKVLAKTDCRVIQFWLHLVWTIKWNRDRSPALIRSLSWERAPEKLVISFSKIKGEKGLFAVFRYSKGEETSRQKVTV